MAGRPLSMVVALGLFVSAIAGLFAYLAWRNLAPMEGWPTVPGRVEASGVVRRELQSSTRGSGGRLHPHWVAEVRYSYTVAGRAFTSTRLANRDLIATWKEGSPPADLAARVAPYRPGAAVSVRHDPADPGYSVLEVDRTALHWLIGGSVAGLLLALVGLFWRRVF